MLRVMFSVVLPLLLPTALYGLWVLAINRHDGADTNWRALPWVWLVVAGVGLAAIVLVAVVQIGGIGEGTYVPPHVEHGTLIPGHVVPAPASR
jgi:hypothetical protein